MRTPARPHARMGQAWICRKSSSQTLKRCVGGEEGGGDNERKFMKNKSLRTDAGRLLLRARKCSTYARIYTRTRSLSLFLSLFLSLSLSLSLTHTHTYTNVCVPIGSCLLVRDAGAVAYPICVAAYHCCRYVCKNTYTNITLKLNTNP